MLEENTKLKKDNDVLSGRLNNSLLVISDLNTRIKDIENEKFSLLAAIRLVQCADKSHVDSTVAAAKQLKSSDIGVFDQHDFDGVSHISISDHSLIYAFRKLSTGLFTKGHSTVTYRKFKNFDSESFRNDIWLQNWDEIRAHITQMTCGMFGKIYLIVLLKDIKSSKASKSPWITPYLNNACMIEIF